MKFQITEKYKGGLILCPVAKENPLENPWSSYLTPLMEKEAFLPEAGSQHLFTPQEGPSILFLGLGEAGPLRLENLRMAAGSGVKKAMALKEKAPAFFLPPSLQGEEAAVALGESLVLGAYAFDQYKTGKKNQPPEEIFLLGEGLEALAASLEEGRHLGEMTALARTLSTESGAVMNPQGLAQAARDLGAEAGFQVTVLETEEIAAQGMEAFLAVGRGSAYEPAFIIMEYMGKPGAPVTGLVGKGITFDSGGLSIKPATSMLTMQGDMSGAASVLAAMGAMARMKLPVNVVGVIAACENSVSGSSYRPNDVLRSRSGKTIFIANTDAEGRLTLIDALDYVIREKKVDRVLDIATLTGAAEVALGQKIAAAITNNESFLEEVKAASRETGERIWELPHDPDFLKLLESPYADLSNSGGRYGGTITAGLFLGSVVGQVPWVHLDIAGPSWSEKSLGYFSKGGTGFGTRLLYRLLKNSAK